MTTALCSLLRGGVPADLSALKPTGLGDNDPFADQRLIAWQGERRAAIGQVTWHGSLYHARYTHTELFVVHSGVLLLEAGATALHIKAGEAALIPQGTAISIRATAPVQWSFCSATAANIGIEQPVQKIDFAVPLKPSSQPAAEVLLSSEPQCRSGGVFADEDIKVRVGIWDSTPYTRKEIPHRLNELMYLLEGSVTLTDKAGTPHVFNQGDIVFVPKGTPCAWHSPVMVKKLYWVQET